MASTLDTAELREFGAKHGNAGRDQTSKIIGQAADEIDRLRKLISDHNEGCLATCGIVWPVP